MCLFVLFCLVLSCLVLFCFVLSCLVLFCFVLSCLVLFVCLLACLLVCLFVCLFVCQMSFHVLHYILLTCLAQDKKCEHQGVGTSVDNFSIGLSAVRTSVV